MARDMARAPRPRTVLVACAILVALVPAGCSSDDDPSSDPSQTPTSQPTSAAPEPDVVTTATVRTVVGKVAPGVRTKLVAEVVEAVDAWIDAAYVDGDYPRDDFGNAFSTFTRGAQARARADLDLMSNAGVGESVDSVRVRRREVEIDVLAQGGRPAGVTVSVRLGLALRGEIERDERVRGRLFLTDTPDGWRIFGYDIERGEV